MGHELNRRDTRGVLGIALAYLLLSGPSAALRTAPDEAAEPKAGEAACAALAAPGVFQATTIASAKMRAPDPPGGVPAFCEVTGTISPVPESRIGVVYRLPVTWNGKLVGYGGGGWAGNVQLSTAGPQLAAGYATAQTDAGHPGTIPFETRWMTTNGRPNAEALTDFNHRAVHLMTTVGKEVVARYYSRPQTRAFFLGCSTGGRMGLMEAQRYPDDYDAIVAGAPVNTLRVQAGHFWHRLVFERSGAAIAPAQLRAINQAVLAACDAQDGLEDGILTDPRTCRSDPAALRCAGGQPSAECLTPGQAAAVKKAYTEIRSGAQVAVFPWLRGSEKDWGRFANVSNDPSGFNTDYLLGLRAPLFGDPEFDLATFDPVRDTPRIRTSAFARDHEAANPDISPFVRKGGKLILWHGFYDPGPSALQTIEYYEALQEATGGKVGAGQVASSVRLYLAPGVYHCSGGPGPDRVDWLPLLEHWVENGVAPERIVATKTGASLSRPWCPYPALPRYRGEGDPNDERSFVCR